jgi:uncharacterized delta-60 repeat protein
VAGYYHKGNGDERFVVGRYKTDGSVDTSFAGDGHRDGVKFGAEVTPQGCLNRGKFLSVAIPLNHKIVAGGYCNTDDFGIMVRYNTDGSLDKTFSVHGDGIGQIAALAKDFKSIVIDANGKVIGGGLGILNQDLMFATARYNTNGLIDPNFGGQGGLLTNLQNGKPEFINSIVIDSNGRIVTGGIMGDP